IRERSGEELDLLAAVEEKVRGVRLGALPGRVRVVRLLRPERDLAGDAVVLDAGVLPIAGGLDVRADVVVIEVPADVPVELAVDGIAGIAVLGAPDLHRALRIARERRHPAGRIDWRVDAAARAGDRVGQRMR